VGREGGEHNVNDAVIKASRMKGELVTARASSRDYRTPVSNSKLYIYQLNSFVCTTVAFVF